MVLFGVVTLTLASCAAGPTEPEEVEHAQSVMSIEVETDSAPAPAETHVDNPYRDAVGYVNRAWADNVIATRDSISTAEPQLAEQMDLVAQQPTAIWMDQIAAIEGQDGKPGLREHLDAALDQASDGDPVVVTVVIYDLPGRDCAAIASGGELAADEEGITRYREDFIDPIAQILGDQKYSDLRIVTLVEPDSLPNLVTNMDSAGCQKAAPLYEEGVVYTLDTFGEIPNIYSYLDAAHSGWLGWESNAQPTAQVFADVLSKTKAGFDSVNGFVTNLSNYTPVTEPGLADPEQIVGGQPVKSAQFYEFNPAFSESAWTADLYQRLIGLGFPDTIGMLIDTSRNGWGGEGRPAGSSHSQDVNAYVDEQRIDRRSHRGAWCNQVGAGLGYLPQASPLGLESSHIDAFIWAKPPGESDGAGSQINNDEGKGADPMCDPGFASPSLGGANSGAMGDAPLSGRWFSAYFVELVRNSALEYSALTAAAQSGASANTLAVPAGPSVMAPRSGCAAELLVNGRWDGGFQASITVIAGQSTSGWHLQVVLPSGVGIENLWGGTASSNSGDIQISNADWNGKLASGQIAEVGFIGSGPGPDEGVIDCSVQ